MAMALVVHSVTGAGFSLDTSIFTYQSVLPNCYNQMKNKRKGKKEGSKEEIKGRKNTHPI
jgi:hypothetical protein